MDAGAEGVIECAYTVRREEEDAVEILESAKESWTKNPSAFL